ncbi:2-aminoethylphosphonate--pyruvate transaminase [Profundibacter amoris]|uniref:2-aminoethylphosphonate--pyruvate transaminase n=1 Tax=Profundibacter amoris TaxID=2171755 RepID=A0A347UHZ5_9RHOB|nr:2-aminoethylphosphonate--pyruvate transaminase [Profundibacter amoris]AXX98473.1 2-aminoethylphosphonate--pyruvate transaminase [Profundibacter amoris]
MSDTAPKIAPPHLGEPYLLTPGPLTTSYAVKQAMLRDWGSWDGDFRAVTAEMRKMLLEMINDTKGEFDCVPMQGSGTFSVEAMLASFTPRDGKVLVLSNGAYGKRIAQTLDYLNRDHVVIDKGDYMPPRGEEVTAALRADPAISHVVVVHCETSSGILNPVAEISQAVYAEGRKLLIDSMSAFGAIPLGVSEIRYEAMVSSANKCIEGVPGFGFVIARKDELQAAKGRSHSLSLDLHAQWAHMNKTGQWRFTPPTHVVVAFLEALKAHRAEGGVAGRGARYADNRDVLVEGMRGLGFETLLKDRWLSPIIVTFFNPAHKSFDFNSFYEAMKRKGFIIYPGKLTVVDSFRIGCIGQMDADVMRQVVQAAKDSLNEMGVPDAAPPEQALIERARLAA